MYPETDIPPLRITDELLREADKYVPEPLEAKMKRFIEDHGLSRELAEQVIRSRYLPLYEELVSKYRGNVQPSLIASTLINTLKSLRAEGVDTDSLSEETLGEIFELLSKDMFSKEAIPDIIRYVCEKRVRPSKAIEDLGIRKLSSEEVERIVEDFIEKNRQEVAKRGDKAYGYVMGRVMEILRGRVDGKIVSEIVRRKLSSIKAE